MHDQLESALFNGWKNQVSRHSPPLYHRICIRLFELKSFSNDVLEKSFEMSNVRMKFCQSHVSNFLQLLCIWNIFFTLISAMADKNYE
jgi:hypothetical protein